VGDDLIGFFLRIRVLLVLEEVHDLRVSQHCSVCGVKLGGKVDLRLKYPSCPGHEVASRYTGGLALHLSKHQRKVPHRRLVIRTHLLSELGFPRQIELLNDSIIGGGEQLSTPRAEMVADGQVSCCATTKSDGLDAHVFRSTKSVRCDGLDCTGWSVGEVQAVLASRDLVRITHEK
jgi:hypothetical protein